MRLIPVLLPLALPRPYTYRVPDGLAVEPGDLVRVPIGPRQAIGCVWDGEGEAVDPTKLKSILSKVDAAPLDERMRRFIGWVADWTLSDLGMVLKLALRSEDMLAEAAARTGLRYTGVAIERQTPARTRTLQVMKDGLSRSRADLQLEAGVSAAVIDGLVAADVLEVVALRPLPMAKPDPEFAPPSLSETQANAAELLKQAVAAKAYRTVLIEGVTGSGKTEVYFEAVAEALRQGRQALILVPEIALTAQFLDRFMARFGERPAEWHSEVPANRRPRVWRGVQTGEVQVIVGARSGLFLPFRDLGLVVVDEEHDTAYKQEDRVQYHARDMAVVRGRISGFPVVLASATPSLESWSNAAQGKYQRIELAQRFGARALPSITAIDLKREVPERGRWLSGPLVSAMAGTLARGEQSLLFLNRRGYAPLTLCRACGHRFKCPSCTAWLVDHRFRQRLQCHHCGHEEPAPRICPACGTEDQLVGVGPGVERIEEEVRARFPEARTMVLSSDVGGGMKRLRSQIEAIAAGDVDVVIGTQLVAKGHNFPGLTLVGVVDADIGLASGDPRAAERTFQLLNQVVGRAGRGAVAGHALVQTHAPEHPLMKAITAGDPAAFYAREAEERRVSGLPPFGRLAAVLVSGSDGPETLGYARRLARAAPHLDGITVLGPAEAPLALLRGRFRYRLLVKSARSIDLQGYMRDWLQHSEPARGSLRVVIDIDPQSFL